MGHWPKDATEFVVAVTYYPHAGSSYANIPKPLLKMLGNPKTIRYTIQNDQILLSKES